MLAAVNALAPVIHDVKTQDARTPRSNGRTARHPLRAHTRCVLVSLAAAARRDVRSSLLALADRDPSLSRRAVVWTVARKEDVDVEFVREELDGLERAGEIYTVGDGVTAEVRRT